MTGLGSRGKDFGCGWIERQIPDHLSRSVSTLPARIRVSWRRINFQAVLVTGYVAGIGLSLVVVTWMPVLALLLTAFGSFSAAVLLRRNPAMMVTLAVAGFVVAGILLGCLRLEALGRSELVPMAGKRAILELTVIKAPKERNGKVSFLAAAERGEYQGRVLNVNEKVLVELYCRDGCSGRIGTVGGYGVEDASGSIVTSGSDRAVRDYHENGETPDSMMISEGMRLRIEGTLRLPESSPGSDFDYSEYLARRGVHTAISADLDSCKLMELRGGVAGAIDSLRRHARHSLTAGGWGAASGLYKGMVLGDVSDVPDAVSIDMRDAGLLHLLAVSGQNVMLLGFVIMLICRALSCSRSAAVVVAVGGIAAYVPLTGADASIVRAGCVGMLGLLAFLAGRRVTRYYLLCLSAAVLLTINPNALFDPGFQLSYAAVMAIYYLVPTLMLLLRFLPVQLAEAVAVSAAAGLVTAPITLAHFQQVSLVTVPANVMAAPVAGPVMLLGVLSVITAPFSGAASWLLNALAVVCTGYLVEVAKLFATMPGAVYVAPVPPLLALASFYAMLAVMAAFIHRIAAGGAYGALALVRKWSVPAFVVIALVAFACFGGTVPPPSAYTVSFLDVGQGDAILIQVPDGATVLVDGGPGSGIIDRLTESGVERIDAVFISHPHADHIAGLIPVLEKYDAGIVYDAGAPSSSPVYLELLRLIEREGIEYRAVREGDALEFGELHLEVLAPGLELAPDDINANSLVLLASYRELDVLMPGDAESDVLNALVLPVVEVLKVSHHGSSDEGLERLLAGIEPDIAVISVGAGNEYGHPHGAALAALRVAAVRLYRTDIDGTVRITLGEGGFAVTTTD